MMKPKVDSWPIDGFQKEPTMDELGNYFKQIRGELIQKFPPAEQ